MAPGRSPQNSKHPRVTGQLPGFAFSALLGNQQFAAKKSGQAARLSGYNRGIVNEPEAPAARKQDEEPMLWCPVCSTRLSERKCKLFCEKCGYYMSCADYY
jgi:hypothetical protein